MDGEQAVEPATERGALLFGRNWRWIRPLAQRYIEAFAGATRPARRDVVDFLRGDAGFAEALTKHRREIRIAQWLEDPQRMQPVAAARSWRIPSIESPGALADWLCLSPSELDWFADLKGLSAKSSDARLRHYHCRVLQKLSGGARLIESPKPRLKEIQRRILTDILDNIPPHPAAHGFIKRRSIRTYAAPHVGERVLLRMDLTDFFPSFPAARIQAGFRTMGYPDSVASLLAGLTTTAAPRTVSKSLAGAPGIYEFPHLPQGAPTSPSLANICSRRMDCRLTGLAESAGAVYTRYADDLAFSGGEEFERRVERFAIHAAAILREEGFSVNHRKTRIMRQSVRQHLAGLVTNRRINIRRADFDLLKATLTNCARFGPESQNREGHRHFRQHLEGRVGFVESIHPARGKRLQELLARIEWPPSYN
jgi:RNA-directed DNA polymerase